MKFHMTSEWLAKKLAEGDDIDVGAGGTRLEDLKREVARKTVTPTVLASAPTDIAKVVRFVREQRGWTRTDMAQLADIDAAEVESIETNPGFDPEPRTVAQLADLCGFSAVLFAELANHRRPTAANTPTFAFAASSKGTGSVSDDEYAVVCTLIEVLSQRRPPGEGP
jgi:transcriptional regulator with XRE-family HTH domain